MKTRIILVLIAIVAVVGRIVLLRHEIANEPMPKPGEVWWSYYGETNMVFAISNGQVLSISEKGKTNVHSKYRYWEFGRLK